MSGGSAPGAGGALSGFAIHNPPFDRLSHGELSDLLGALDIGYFRPGEAIVQTGRSSEALHVVPKGRVEVGVLDPGPAGLLSPCGRRRGARCAGSCSATRLTASCSGRDRRAKPSRWTARLRG